MPLKLCMPTKIIYYSNVQKTIQIITCSMISSGVFNMRPLPPAVNIQGVQEKMCFFFTIHCNPYLAVRDLQSSQRNASVQSLLLAGNFLYNQ